MSKNPNLVIIGDVHGKTSQYLNIARQYKYSIQIGDFDFKYDAIKKMDANRHKLLPGNHDNYNILLSGEVPNYLGDFGILNIDGFPYDGKIFYLRGAWSIDQKYRKQGVSWWPEEEITIEQGYKALELYEKEKPQFVITHEAPHELIKNKIIGLYDICIETRTGMLLQRMFEIHKPKVWVHGHHHVFKDVIVKGTRFICLPELGTAIVPLNGNGKIRLEPNIGKEIVYEKETEYEYVNINDVEKLHGKPWAERFFRVMGAYTKIHDNDNHIDYNDYTRFADKVDFFINPPTGGMD